MKTRSSYRKQLERLEAHVQALGQGVVDDVRDTGFAIAEGNTSAAEEVIEGHRASERLHRTIEDACMNMMLLQSPVASDLRLITATFRVIGDLARIDEMAYETALLTQEIDLGANEKLARDLGDMSQRAAEMVEKACDAFDDVDVDAANQVFPLDDNVDALYDKVKAEVVELLRNGEEPVTIAPEVLSVAKYYERMGDHAQSIADWGIFRATGEFRGRALGEDAK
jgi:phosphate transport system protein